MTKQTQRRHCSFFQHSLALCSLHGAVHLESRLVCKLILIGMSGACKVQTIFVNGSEMDDRIIRFMRVVARSDYGLGTSVAEASINQLCRILEHGMR